MSLVMNTARSNHICAYSLTVYSNTDLQVRCETYGIQLTDSHWHKRFRALHLNAKKKQ